MQNALHQEEQSNAPRRIPQMRERQPARWHLKLNRKVVFTGLAIYFLLHLIGRVLVSDTLELDQAEQVLWSQSWHWGYGLQPPLYTWIQSSFFAVFGLNVFALAALKALLLFGTCGGVHLCAKEITADEELSILSMLGLFLLPQFAYESQRDLTHSVLTTCLAAYTLLAFVKVSNTGRPLWYVLLGLGAGLGLLAKYNFAVFLVILLLAGASLRSYRARLLRPWIGLTVICFMLVIAGHFCWLIQNSHVPKTLDTLRFSRNAFQWSVEWQGVRGLFSALGSYFGPLCAFFGLLLIGTKSGTRTVSFCRAEEQLLHRFLIGAIVFCGLAVLVFHAQMKDRWLQPLLFLLPVWFLLLTRDRLTPARKAVMTWTACAAAAILLVVLPVIPLLASVTGRPNRLNAPYAEWSKELQERFGVPAVILADSCWPGGNLKRHFPASLVLAPECPQPNFERAGKWLVVWEPNGSEGPPAALKQMLGRAKGAKFQELARAYVEAPCKYFPSRRMKLNYLCLQTSAEAGLSSSR